MRNKVFYSIALVGLALTVVFPASAATLQSGDTLTFSMPVMDNLYAAGGKVTISESIAKDAWVAGGQILINSPVQEDLVVGGGTIVVNGAVGGDARIAGGDITVNSTIGGDLVVAGGSITITNKTQVSGDVVLAGGMVVFDGVANKAFKVRAGDVQINGSILGEANVQGDTLLVNGEIRGQSKIAAKTIALGEKAKFSNSVSYWQSAGQLNFRDTVATGTVMFSPELKPGYLNYESEMTRAAKGFFAAWTIMSLLTAALVLALMVAFCRKTVRRASEKLDDKFWKHVGVGLLYIIVTPIVVVGLFMTLIGWPLALALLCVYLFSLYFVKALAALLIALWVQKKYKKQWKPIVIYGMSLVAFIVLKLLAWIPVVGWIAMMIIFAETFGSMLAVKMEMYKEIEK